MMALLWNDVLADIASSKKHFAQATSIFDEDLGVVPPSYKDTMAFQHAMQSGYTSFEAAMKRLMHLLHEPLPSGPDSHAALLRRLSQQIPGQRPAVLTAELYSEIDGAIASFRAIIDPEV